MELYNWFCGLTVDWNLMAQAAMIPVSSVVCSTLWMWHSEKK